MCPDCIVLSRKLRNCLWNTLQMNFDDVNGNVAFVVCVRVCIYVWNTFKWDAFKYKRCEPALNTIHTNRVYLLLTYIFVLMKHFLSHPTFISFSFSPCPLLAVPLSLSLQNSLFSHKHFSIVEIYSIFRHATMCISAESERAGK